MQRKFFPMLAICLSALIFSTTASAQKKYTVSLNGNQEAPSPVATAGKGSCVVTLNAAETQITIGCSWSGLTSNVVAGHIHNAGPVGVAGPVRFNFSLTGGTSGSFATQTFTLGGTDLADLKSKRWYVNIHTVNFSGGEIRGQVKAFTTPYDADGDGRTDITVFRQSANTVYTLNSTNNSISAVQFGSGTGDNFLNGFPSDYDGDGRADPMLLKLNGTTGDAFWSVLRTSTNSISTVQWGNFATANLEQLVIGDYDGDGKQDYALFRRSQGFWYILESSTNTGRVVQNFGAVNDQASVGDYDGDGKTDLCVVRTESGQRVWYILNSSDGQSRRIVWGASATDGFNFFATVDIDGDGKQDIMVNRNVGGQRTFYALRSSDNQPYVLGWGSAAAPADTALFGDYDGDGKTDFVARRANAGLFDWYIFQSSTQTGRVVTFGQTGDTRFPEQSAELLESTGDLLEF